MSELNDFLKLISEAKAKDPKHQKIKQVKENIKSDLGSLFGQLSSVIAEDPKQKLVNEVKEHVKNDVTSLLEQLTEIKQVPEAAIEAIDELVEAVEAIEEVEHKEVVAEEVLIEVAAIENENPIEKLAASMPKEQTFEQPEVQKVNPEFKVITDKLKFLEQWVAKISAAGPGGGEVNLRWLDDIDRSTITDGYFLTYNADTKKFEFREVVGGSGGIVQVQSDWTETNTALKSYIKHKPDLFSGSYNDLTDKPTLFSGSYTDLTNKPTLFSGSYNDLTDKPTIPSAQVNADWNASTGVAQILNKPTIPDVGHIEEVFAATSEPMGHADFTQSAISFNDSTRTFTISPVGASYDVWVKGNKFTITNTRTVTIPNTTGLYYVYFDLNGALQYKTSFFDWPNDCMTAYVYWNATTGKAPFVADERHGITLDWQTHEYLHRTRGAAIANGFGATNYVINGDGSSNTHLQIDIAGGTFFDEDLQVDVVSTNTPRPNTWDQDLTGPSRIPIFYLNGNAWVLDDPTNYPVKMGTLPKYNAYSGGTWTTPDIDNNKFGVTFIIATNNINYPVIGIIGQTQHSNKGDAEAVDFSSLNLTGFPVVEMRPLYKLVYECKNSYTNTVNARLTSVFDQRSFSSTVSAVATYTDHGALGGLADDDHPQYLLRTDADTLITTAISNVVGAAPDALNTLKEIADQLANDESAVSSLTTSISSVAAGNLSGLNVNNTSGGFIATITGAASGAYGAQTWRFWTNTGIGGPGSYMEFPDGSLQTTAWTGTYSYNDLTNKPTLFSGAGSALTGTSLAVSIVSSSLTSVGTLTSATVDYQPGTTTGAAITASAKNSQGGTGFADFLKATNTSTGTTSGSKWFRINNIGTLEVVNNAYSATILSLADNGDLNVKNSISVNGKISVNGPAFSVYQNTAQSVPTDVQTKLNWNVEEYDTNGNFDNNRFTPTVAGYYTFTAAVRFDSGIGTGERMIVIYKNGSEYKRGYNTKGTAPVGDSWMQMEITCQAYANGTGDYFEVYAMHGAGANRNTTGGAPFTYFQGCMMRGA